MAADIVIQGWDWVTIGFFGTVCVCTICWGVVRVVRRRHCDGDCADHCRGFKE